MKWMHTHIMRVLLPDCRSKHSHIESVSRGSYEGGCNQMNGRKYIQHQKWRHETFINVKWSSERWYSRWQFKLIATIEYTPKWAWELTLQCEHWHCTRDRERERERESEWNRAHNWAMANELSIDLISDLKDALRFNSHADNWPHFTF